MRQRIRYGLSRSEDKRVNLIDACEELLETFVPPKKLSFWEVCRQQDRLKGWLAYDEPEAVRLREIEDAWDSHYNDCPRCGYERCDCYYWNTLENVWYERDMERRYVSEYCDQIPFGDSAFHAMETHYDYDERCYIAVYGSVSANTKEEIETYEQQGLVPRDQDIKPTKEREVICFPWQGVTVYTRH